MEIFLTVISMVFLACAVWLGLSLRERNRQLLLADEIFISSMRNVIELEKQLAASHRCLELLLTEETKDLRDAHFCIELLLQDS